MVEGGEWVEVAVVRREELGVGDGLAGSFAQVPPCRYLPCAATLTNYATRITKTIMIIMEIMEMIMIIIMIMITLVCESM